MQINKTPRPTVRASWRPGRGFWCDYADKQNIPTHSRGRFIVPTADLSALGGCSALRFILFADVVAKEQDQRSFFLRMYGKLFVLTACVAQNVPSRGLALPHSARSLLARSTRNKVECCSRLIHRR